MIIFESILPIFESSIDFGSSWVVVKIGPSLTTNKTILLVWFSMFYQLNFMLITNNNAQIHGYNEQNNCNEQNN